MKQVIGIYCGDMNDNSWDDVTVRENGAGGSETWVVEIASGFQKRGFHVIVFAQPEYWKFASDGVEYVPWYMFKDRCQYQHFDYFISWRRLDIIDSFIPCNNIYAIAEDMNIYCGENNDTKLSRIKKIGYLSEFGKYRLQYKHPELTDDNLFYTFNPVPYEPYEDVSCYHKKNQMVWSSVKYRGLPYFVKNIFPKIRESVPDFELYICSYMDVNDDYLKVDGIHLIGCLGKQELANLQKESKIWVYPNEGCFYDGTNTFFQETFCNTAVENALAENAIFCFNIGGLRTTLQGYSGMIGEWGDKYSESLYIYNEKDMNEATSEMINNAIRALTDEDYRHNLAMEAKDICSRYTAYNAVDTWLKEWGIKY